MDRAKSPRSGPLAVTVLSGFLGAGKTTLLRRLLRERSAMRIGTIVNDLSDLPVDAELIREARERRDEQIIDLHNGSLGGSLRPQFLAALDEFAADRTLDYALVETSGGTHPQTLIQDLQMHPGIRLDTFVTVVDGLNLLRDFDSGRTLVDARVLLPTSHAARLRVQIDVASVLLVSKADTLTRAQAHVILASLQQINPRALIITAAFGAVDPKYLIDSGSYAARKARSRATVQESDDPGRFDLGAVTIRDPRPFHPRRLHTLFSEGLPMGVHRSKGWLWLASRPLDVLVWSQAGSHVGLEWAATWKAGILDDPDARMLPEERRGLAQQMQALHPVFGDRHCELTIIGHLSDRERFVDALHACLCRDNEIEAWQRGETFEDPWPRTIRKV